MAAQLGAQGVVTIKEQVFAKKSCVLSQKPSKNGFFRVFRSTPRRFGVSRYDSDDAQTHRIAAQLNAQGVATIKEALLRKKN